MMIEQPNHDRGDADVPPSEDSVDRTRELLSGFQPRHIDSVLWKSLRREVIPVLASAGELTRTRLRKDAEAVAAMAAYLLTVSTTVTLDEVLSDAHLRGFEEFSRERGQSWGSISNRRGRLRRLSAVHRGLPWRSPRRADGEKIASLPSAALAHVLASLIRLAQAGSEIGAAELLAAVSDTYRDLHSPATDRAQSAEDWSRAVAFASGHGVSLDRRSLRSAVTHTLLMQKRPLASLACQHGLNRRDLELGLSQMTHLPAIPDPLTVAMLRGS